MGRYRKKPLVIEAFQWQGEEVLGLQRIAVGITEKGHEIYNLIIPTREGMMYASPGDWIITGIAGEQYPCKPEIFAASYEEVP